MLFFNLIFFLFRCQIKLAFIQTNFIFFIILVFLMQTFSISLCYCTGSIAQIVYELSWVDKLFAQTHEHEEALQLILQGHLNIYNNQKSAEHYSFGFLENIAQKNEISYLNNRIYWYAYNIHNSAIFHNLVLLNFKTINEDFPLFLKTLKTLNSAQSVSFKQAADLWAFLYVGIKEYNQKSLLYFIYHLFIK